MQDDASTAKDVHEVRGHVGGLPGVDADLEYFGDSRFVLVTLSKVDGVSGPIRREAIAVLATKSYFGHPEGQSAADSFKTAQRPGVALVCR